MSRRLLKQMATEWSSNIWLVVELIVVSVVLWYISDFLYIKADVALQPIRPKILMPTTRASSTSA